MMKEPIRARCFIKHTVYYYIGVKRFRCYAYVCNIMNVCWPLACCNDSTFCRVCVLVVQYVSIMKMYYFEEKNGSFIQVYLVV